MASTAPGGRPADILDANVNQVVVVVAVALVVVVEAGSSGRARPIDELDRKFIGATVHFGTDQVRNANLFGA